MNLTFKGLVAALKEKNIRLSHQRLKVLEYLANNRIHPTAEQIYSVLQSEVPTLSKTTIYNTLNVLIRAGMVRVISIEERETRYDIDTQNHGHFKCESCGAIFDFSIDIDAFTADDLNGFEINDKNVYFKGSCPTCLANKK